MNAALDGLDKLTPQVTSQAAGSPKTLQTERSDWMLGRLLLSAISMILVLFPGVLMYCCCKASGDSGGDEKDAKNPSDKE